MTTAPIYLHNSDTSESLCEHLASRAGNRQIKILILVTEKVEKLRGSLGPPSHQVRGGKVLAGDHWERYLEKLSYAGMAAGGQSAVFSGLFAHSRVPMFLK